MESEDFIAGQRAAAAVYVPEIDRLVRERDEARFERVVWRALMLAGIAGAVFWAFFL